MQDRIVYRTDSLRLFTQLASITGVIIGLSVIIGWAFKLAVLKSLPSTLRAMNPTTAVSFIFSGLSLWLLHKKFAGKEKVIRYRAGLVCALAVALIGLLRLSEYLFGWNLGMGVDAFLFQEKVIAEANRLAPNTALGFLFWLCLCSFWTRKPDGETGQQKGLHSSFSW